MFLSRSVSTCRASNGEYFVYKLTRSLLSRNQANCFHILLYGGLLCFDSRWYLISTSTRLLGKDPEGKDLRLKALGIYKDCKRSIL